jgi:Polysaccharide biosynthesis/export protein/SLBB domain
MRAARILLPILVALTAAACTRHAPSYSAVDPASGQPVVQQSNQPHDAKAYGQQAYAAPKAYAQSQAQDDNRGLFTANRRLSTAQPSTPTAALQSYAQQPYPQNGKDGYVQQQTYGPRSYVLQYRPPQDRPPQAARAAPASTQYAYAYAPANQPYTLDSGDKLRVVVFGQQGITGSYMVDASGNVSLPLIGTVPARGRTTERLSATIAERLKQGYVREPHVTVEVEAYRPFFILGEVTNPGQYPYVANMTAENAIAIAGGFAPRADKREVELTRNSAGQPFKGEVPLSYPLRPGDTVMVKERWF